MARPVGIVAAWEIPQLTKDDFSITYRLETYDAESTPVVEEVVMHPTQPPEALAVTAADRRSDGHYRLCSLTVKPGRRENPPPIPNTRAHTVIFTIRYGSLVLHTYTLTWLAYAWTRTPKKLDVLAANGESLVDLNRTARLMVINQKYKRPDRVIDTEGLTLRYSHTPRIVIHGERGPTDWKPGQEAARDRQAVFTNQPREYYLKELNIFIDAVCLHNTRKMEAHRKRMERVIEIEPLSRLLDNYAVGAVVDQRDLPADTRQEKETETKKKRKNKKEKEKRKRKKHSAPLM